MGFSEHDVKRMLSPITKQLSAVCRKLDNLTVGGGGGASIDGTAIEVCDATDNTIKFLVEVVFDEATSTFTYRRTTGATVVEGTHFVICPDPTNSDNSQIVDRCLCDDVAGDGSNIVSFVRKFAESYDGTTYTSNLIGDYTDSDGQTPYTVQGTVGSCNSLGTEPQWATDVTTLSVGQSWSPSVATKSFTVSVLGAYDGSIGATFTDSQGDVENLPIGTNPTWGNEDYFLTNPLPIVTATAVEVLIIETKLV